VAAVPVGQRTGQEINEFGAGVLKARKHLALVGQGDEKRLEGLARPALRGQQMVGMAATGAAPNHLQPLPRGNSLRPLLVPADLLQEQGGSHAERAGQRQQSLQTGRDMAGFQTAEHPGADPGRGGHIRQRQTLAFTHAPRHGAQLPAHVVRGGGGSRARCRGFR